MRIKQKLYFWNQDTSYNNALRLIFVENPINYLKNAQFLRVTSLKSYPVCSTRYRQRHSQLDMSRL